MQSWDIPSVVVPVSFFSCSDEEILDEYNRAFRDSAAEMDAIRPGSPYMLRYEDFSALRESGSIMHTRLASGEFVGTETDDEPCALIYLLNPDDVAKLKDIALDEDGEFFGYSGADLEEWACAYAEGHEALEFLQSVCNRDIAECTAFLTVTSDDNAWLEKYEFFLPTRF